MGSLFKRGYKASREEKKKQDDNRKKNANRLFDFFVTSDDGEPAEADLVFLNEEPVNFFMHNLYDGTNVTKYTCPGENCPICAKGENRPTATGAYLVIDRRPYKYKDKEGKEHRGDERIKMFKMGMRVVSQLDRISTKRGLTNKIMTIVRMGKGQGTTYTFEDGESCKYTTDEIKKLMPENMAEKWDGTEDGIMDIIEEQLMLNLPEGCDESDDSNSYSEDDEEVISRDEEPSKPKSSGKKKKSLFKKSGKEIDFE